MAEAGATEAGRVAARVAALERAHGIEVVTASIAKADVYPELPWRAGALAASLTALCVAIGDVLRPDWATSTTLLVSLATVMIVGAGVSLLAISCRRSRGCSCRARAPRSRCASSRTRLPRARSCSARARRDAVLISSPSSTASRSSPTSATTAASPRPSGKHHRADAAAAARGPRRRGADRGARRARRAARVAAASSATGARANELPDATMHEDEGDR